MSEIRSITFTRTAPQDFDESWSANLSGTSDITGYRAGRDVIIAGDVIYANPYSARMFAGHNDYGDPLWSNLVSVNGLDLIDTSLVVDMEQMFAFYNPDAVDGIGGWDVSNVHSFSGMFQGNDHVGDVNLAYLDIGDWDTSSAESMSHMFYGCAKMEYIPTEHWNVSNVESFSHMFADCNSLRSVDFSNWNTESAKSFDGFLNDCHALKSVDVSNFQTDNCIQFSQMFEYCVNLEYIHGLENWNVSNASYYAFSETFHGCKRLKEINISSWMAKPDNVARMFKDCHSLSYIDLSGFDMSNCRYSDEVFAGCSDEITIVW